MPLKNGDLVQPIPADQTADRGPTGELVSVIVPCCGQLEYTRLCVRSILRHSRRPFELVFVDMASVDGPAEYLAGVAAAASVPVGILRTAPDASFSAACNAAVAQSRGEFLVLLNNDTVVTDRWLDHLVALARMDSAVGLVGPMCNSAAAPQRVAAVTYRLQSKDGYRSHSEVESALDTVNRFACQWRDQHRGQWLEAETLAPFCLLIKREVLPAIGQFHGESALGLSGEDLCQRARQAGYRSVCCQQFPVPEPGRILFGLF